MYDPYIDCLCDPLQAVEKATARLNFKSMTVEHDVGRMEHPVDHSSWSRFCYCLVLSFLEQASL
jgi:hypothetical protein